MRVARWAVGIARPVPGWVPGTGHADGAGSHNAPTGPHVSLAGRFEINAFQKSKTLNH